MTRKDYELIARVIRETIARGHLTEAAGALVGEDFALALSETNPRFDHGRFVAACLGGHDEEGFPTEYELNG